MQAASVYTRDRSNGRRKRASAALPGTAFAGLRLANLAQEPLLAWLCVRLNLQIPTRIAFATARSAYAAATRPAYGGALCTADAVLPSGPGIALALRLRGERLEPGLGADTLIPALCRQIAPYGHGLFLLGGAPGIALSAADTLRRAVPGLIVAGARHGLEPGENEQRLVRSINASGAAIVLVGEGAVAPDVWLARNAARLSAALTIGAGRAFDRLASRNSVATPAAPAFVAPGRHEHFIDTWLHHTGCAGSRTALSSAAGHAMDRSVVTQLADLCEIARKMPAGRAAKPENGAEFLGREHWFRRPRSPEKVKASQESARQMARARLAARLWASLPAAHHPSAWY